MLFFRITAVLALGWCGAARGALHPGAGVGDWIWAEEVHDRQECRFARAFDIPEGARVESALLRITADNSYQVFLNGQPVGRGGDWRVLIEYDVTRLLGPGRHRLTVSALNDFDVAGLLAGLSIRLDGGRRIEIASDESWLLVPLEVEGWPLPRERAGLRWRNAVVRSRVEDHWRPSVYHAPVSEPVVVTLWERRWFQVTLVAAGAAGFAAVLFLSIRLVLKSQAARVVRRERSRIAADLHDNLGGELTQLVLLGDRARRPAGEVENMAGLDRVGEQARRLMRHMNETVWLIDSRRDTARDLAGYLTRHAETFFQDTGVRCRFDVADAPAGLGCDIGVRRNVLLAVKEALNNVLRHSGASEVVVSVTWRRDEMRVGVRDDGRGFDPASVRAGDGLRNMEERAREAGGRLAVESRPGEGCRVLLQVPMGRRARPA